MGRGGLGQSVGVVRWGTGERGGAEEVGLVQEKIPDFSQWGKLR